MRRYSVSDEEQTRAQRRVREWSRAGLLDSSQTARIEAALRVDFRRTNHFLRSVLFVFTILVAAASVLLNLTIFNLNDELPVALAGFVGALCCFGLAEYLITRFGLYRFGIEEGFAAAAAALLSLATAAMVSLLWSAGPIEFPIAVALFVGALSSLGIYLRFGYVYGAVASMVCGAMIPFQFNMAAETQRVVAAGMFAVVFVQIRSKRRLYGEDFPGDDYGIIQAFAWAGLYLALNLQIEPIATKGPVYWLTYVMIWVLPIIGLSQGLREKDRALIDLSAGMILVTLATNKAYLGAPSRRADHFHSRTISGCEFYRYQRCRRYVHNRGVLAWLMQPNDSAESSVPTPFQ